MERAVIRGAGRVNPGRDWSIVKRIIIPTDPKYPGWYHINKNGTTTMSDLIRRLKCGSHHYYGHDDYPADRPIYCMWRDPAERMESAWRMYQNQDQPQWSPMSLEEFVLKICGPQKLCLRDPHLLPQVEVCSNKYGRFVPDVVLKWDWSGVERLYGIPPIRRNEQPRDEEPIWTEQAREAFNTRFKLDYLVWFNIARCLEKHDAHSR